MSAGQSRVPEGLLLVWRALRVVFWVLSRALWWTVRHPVILAVSVVVWAGFNLFGVSLSLFGVLLPWWVLLALPLVQLLRAVWALSFPWSYERFLGGPLRRAGWRKTLRKMWPSLAEDCGICRTRTVKTEDGTKEVVVYPKLRRLRTYGDVVTFRVRAMRGQIEDTLHNTVEPIATAMGAEDGTSDPVENRPGLVQINLTMRNLLATPSVSPVPTSPVYKSVRLGKDSNGLDWMLPIAGLHTLVAGCSGSGKGSHFWGIAAQLTPAVQEDLVNLWGIDLKGGVEIAIGQDLFTHVAMDEDEALNALKQLWAVVQQRQNEMRGRSRNFVPTPGDPMHVLLIDELAVMTAYGSPDFVKEAGKLLRMLLTQARAFGVIIIGFVQDPRKEIVSDRGLFTQTVALRLRSSTETSMVLGDGMSAQAPAHKLSATNQGIAYVVTESGRVSKVRADYWTDNQITVMAFKNRAPAGAEIPSALSPAPAAAMVLDDAAKTDTLELPVVEEAPEQSAPRKPRARRKPRATRAQGGQLTQGGSLAAGVRS